MALSDHRAMRLSWSIDQTAMGQGITPEERQWREHFAAQETALWQKADKIAAIQPIVSGCDDTVLAVIEQTVARLSAVADTLVVIGTGGASLGAQALCAFAPRPVKILFLDNCDAQTISDIFARCDDKRTAWAIISKSGGTVETLAASLALMAHYDAAQVDLTERVVVITSAGARPLRALAEYAQWPLLDHPAELGGRFSVFSAVGLLPAAFAKLDIRALLTAAQTSWTLGLTQRDPLIFDAASWFAASLRHHPLHVVMGYNDRLRPYTHWYKQLWAESLGKQGQGPTPITAIGSIDQHSQLQLYLDGARDKLFTLILPDGAGVSVPLAKVDLPEIAYLSVHKMQAIMHASAEATVVTLKAKNLPIRVLKAPLSATALCELMARSFLETLLVAAMLEIDPYSQPAVEEGKDRARAKLGLPK